LKTNENYKNSFRRYSHNAWTGVVYGYEYRTMEFMIKDNDLNLLSTIFGQ